MGGDEDAILRIDTFGLRHLVEAFQAMHLAVPERVLDLVVGLGDDQRSGRPCANRGAEQLVALGDALRGHRNDVVFDHVEETVDQDVSAI